MIIHYTALPLKESLIHLTQSDVSSHYFVNKGPNAIVYQLVPEDRRAYHAGISGWQGLTDLNSSSVGIEIENLGWRGSPLENNWDPYDENQIEVVLALIKDVVKRNNIRPDRILGHSDIAPQLKQDPGPLFPWKRLAQEGLIIWPDPKRVAESIPQYQKKLPEWSWFKSRLSEIGYRVQQGEDNPEKVKNIVSAFQMKYRSEKVSGEVDAETAAILTALLQVWPKR